MARNLLLLVAILAAGVFAASAQANLLQAWAQMDARVAWHSDNHQPGLDHKINWFALGMTIGFDQDQKVVVGGSDYTIVHNDLTPGETVNFKIALKDTAKQVKYVKVTHRGHFEPELPFPPNDI